MAIELGGKFPVGHEDDDKLKREVLKKFLKGERTGSIKILALSDKAAYFAATNEVALYKPKGNGSLSTSYLKAVTREGEIEETIRNRELSHNAAAYIAAYGNNEVWEAYLQSESEIDNLQQRIINAAKALLKDLKETNTTKSSRRRLTFLHLRKNNKKD